jgi:acyl-CoA synthetase (AMP-forming)/AMP-acid ligase II
MPIYEEIAARLTGPGSPFEVVTEPVLGEPMGVFKQRRRSLRELFAASAAHGDKHYIVNGERRISYRQHVDEVGSLAKVLREDYGIRHGDRVAILGENHPEWIASFWAAVSSGAIVAALNGWWTEDEIRYGLGLSQPSVLIADKKRLARLSGDPGVRVIEMESECRGFLTRHPRAELPDVPIAEDDPAVILFTSGTTGRPKGAVNTHRGIVGFVHTQMLSGALRGMLRSDQGEVREENPPPTVCLQTSPLFHLSGLYSGAVMMLAIGATTVWRTGRFDPEDVLRTIERERITSWSGLGSTAPRVLNHPKVGSYDLSSLRNLGSGGAPTSPTLQKRITEVAPNGYAALGLGYGLSESVTVPTQISGFELRERPTSVGRVQPTHQVEIRDAQGRALPEGVEGEIFIRSPYLMLGYWRNPEATAKTIHPGRWLATGDIGRFEDGYLYINSRARDMILRGAENVYPIEIEHRIEAHPTVSEAAVVGVDHPELGQEVKAIVVPARGASVDPVELDAWCRATLAPYKVPAHWEIRREPLPRNAAGKILKNVLTGESENRFVED